MGISNKIPADTRDAKHILEYVLHQVVEFKKLNQVCNAFIYKYEFTYILLLSYILFSFTVSSAGNVNLRSVHLPCVFENIITWYLMK